MGSVSGQFAGHVHVDGHLCCGARKFVSLKLWWLVAVLLVVTDDGFLGERHWSLRADGSGGQFGRVGGQGAEARRLWRATGRCRSATMGSDEAWVLIAWTSCRR
jgi:hypothetical protein